MAEIVRAPAGRHGYVYLPAISAGRYVAIKVLNASELAYEDRRPLREALSRGDSPSECGDDSISADAGGAYIVMGIARAKRSQRIRRRPIRAWSFCRSRGRSRWPRGRAREHHPPTPRRELIVENGTVRSSTLIKALPRSVTDPPSEDIRVDRDISSARCLLSPEQARGGNADAQHLFSVASSLSRRGGSSAVQCGSAVVVLTKSATRARPFAPVDPSFPPSATKIIAHLLQKNPDAIRPRANCASQEIDADGACPRPRRADARRTLPAARATGCARRSRWCGVDVALAVFIGQRTTSARRRPRRASADPFHGASLCATSQTARATNSFGRPRRRTGDEAAKIPSLQVRPTSRSSNFRPKTDTRPPARWKVDGILGDTFAAAISRVTLQLTDSRGLRRVDRHDRRKRSDLLNLIDDVSARTVDGLKKIDRAGIGLRPIHARRIRKHTNSTCARCTAVLPIISSQITALQRAIALDPHLPACRSRHHPLPRQRTLVSPEGSRKRKATRDRPCPDRIPEAISRWDVFSCAIRPFPRIGPRILAALRLGDDRHAGIAPLVTYFVSTGDLPKSYASATGS
jgi:hypothetical protein